MTLIERRAVWSGHITEFRKSGLSQRKYCLQHGIKSSTLSYWHKRAETGEKRQEMARFSKVAIMGSSDRQTRVQLPFGIEIHTEGLPAPEWLAGLVKKMGEQR
jgi:hypothetical protein